MSSTWSLPARHYRNGLLLSSKTAFAKRHSRIRVRNRGFRDFAWALGSSLRLGYVVPAVIACRPHPPVWPPPSNFPAMPVIGTVFGFSAFLHFCRAARPSGLSLLCSSGLPSSVSAGRFSSAYPSSSILTMTIMGKWEPLGISNNPATQPSRGDSNFDDLSVRSRYGPPDCSLPGLIRTEKSLPA